MAETVPIQGDRGNFSEQAARTFFDDREVEVMTCPDHLRVVQELREDRLGVVPIENTAVGTFTAVADILMEHHPWILGEVVLPVDHALVVHPGADVDALERVVGHPTVWTKCRRFLRDRDLEAIAVSDPAEAVREVKEQHGPKTAAIGPAQAAKLHDMEVVRSAVQDHPDNRTRFFVLTRFRRDVPDDADKTSVGFVASHEPGALHRSIETFADHGINLERLDCRPIPDRPWHYAFHADLGGALGDPDVDSALKTLGQRTLEVRVFGSYRRGKET